MNFQTFLIITEIMVLQLQYCKPVIKGVAWETANEHCRSQNDSIVDIKDVRNKLSFLTGLQPIWSPLKGQFTPWIAYRGCFGELSSICVSLTGSKFTNTKCHTIINNTVGNCYFECRSKSKSDGGCETTTNFFFGLQESICFCLCDNTRLKLISESKKCNILCNTSINNGECGGKNFFSVYESTDFVLPETHLSGFCLTCRLQSDANKTLLYSMDCNENAAGHCVVRNGEALSLPPIMSTFASYWRYCRNQNTYIVGDITQTFCQKDISIWTGLRKFYIENSNIAIDSCFIIEVHNQTVTYKERNCTEPHFFLCKQEISREFVTSIPKINTTKNSAPPPFTRTPWTTKTISSNKSMFTNANTTCHFKSTNKTPSLNLTGNEAAIAGACTAGTLALIFVFLFGYLLKRRRLHCLQAKLQQTNRLHKTNNATYDDLVVTSRRHDDNHSYTTLSYDKQAE